MMVHLERRALATPPLVTDYLAARTPAADFYDGHPAQVDHFAAKLREVAGRFGEAERTQAAAALRPPSAAAADRLRKFVRHGGAVVTTGQQAGLFGGPLYTTFKILSAIRLAAELEARLGTVVLPVFWVASEDHDWQEVNHTYTLDQRLRLHRLTAESPQRLPLPMSERTFGPALETALAEMSHLLSESADAARQMHALREAYTVGSTVAGAFRQWVHQTFAGFDLLTTDAADPALKAASIPLLQAEVEQAVEHEREVRARADALEARGYRPQVPVLAGAANLFWNGPAGRERLQWAQGGWTAPLARERFTPAALVRRIAADPQRFSPNVLLRPVVESTVFPTLAYVGGPAEMAYFAQLQPLFARAGIRMPVVYPRLSATLVPAPVDALLAEWGLDLTDAMRPAHDLLSRLARWSVPPSAAAAFGDLRRAVVDRYADVIGAVEQLDGTAAASLEAERDRALLGVASAEKKVVAALKRADARLPRAATALHNVLFPTQNPQERVLNAVPFLAWDADLLHRLVAAVPMPGELAAA